jgi:hypothetical protein
VHRSQILWINLFVLYWWVQHCGFVDIFRKILYWRLPAERKEQERIEIIINKLRLNLFSASQCIVVSLCKFD